MGRTMDIPKPEIGMGRTPKNLMKNSIIAVTIDDLNEGLIVVSFPHEGNLYQGVLLQLNRERGIPSGISFPKDYCTGSVVEPLGENDPTQVPPLPQRHTYFQDKDGSLADPMKARLALRRVIKPPARFKNSRMSLRLRSRPILCAKCRTLCEDKVSSQSSDTQEDAELSKKIVSGGGVTTRRGKSTMGVTLTSNIPSTQESESTQDYSYVSVGSKTFIENYWKRPSLLPPPDEKVGRSNSSTPLSSCQGGPLKPPTDSMVVVKSVPKMPKINSSCMNENKLTLTLTKDNNNKVLPKLLVSSNPGFEKTVKIKKSKNFKAYKAKLLNTSSSPNQVEKPVEPRDLTEIPEERLGDQYVVPATAHLPELNLDPVDVGLKDDLSANSKMWENRIRKKSTVPARFRDEGYLTKNIFSFKRRRVEDDATEEGESPEHRLVPFEDMDQEGVEKETNKLSPGETSSSSDISRTSGTPNFPLPPLVGSVGGTNGHADAKVEPAKTPVIKISFGTPGNGVVVEIPPKAKQEETGSLADKAARKAMKKAKKEARRKLSLSREPSPSAKHALPQTPSPPASNPECSLVPNCVEPATGPTTPEVKPDVNLLEPHHVSKRKKKEKKKKRSKPTKDNCDSTVSQSGTTPPYEDSSENYERISPTPDEPVSTSNLVVRIPQRSPEQQAVESDGNRSIDDSPESKIGCSTASSSEAPQRLCISLKRLNDNSMVSWDITQSCITCSHNELDSGETEQVGSPTSSEPNDYPMNDSPSSEQRNANASSIDSYTDECRNYQFKKGDIIWGKLPGCPWWPGKILDILFVDVDDVTAKVSWYRASTLSCIRFSQLGPFAEQFETRYTRSRKRGSYQHAVRDALIEAHQLDPNDLPSD
ncbi:unnamed protein product [Allacma fusca]|uniref:PWWP domain-containing protein n=1 Tax=Allacma fusca TaxID=39272 RepID=A0A8J2JZE4_9HEXA|nr:unnamed protein product [Allacma fusca]